MLALSEFTIEVLHKTLRCGEPVTCAIRLTPGQKARSGKINLCEQLNCNQSPCCGL